MATPSSALTAQARFLNLLERDILKMDAAELAGIGNRGLAETEAANCYYHLHTFFSRYWDDGDFIPRARRGGTAAYSVPYNGQDTHFHWATKGSHYVKSGELFSRYAYNDGAHEVRFVILHLGAGTLCVVAPGCQWRLCGGAAIQTGAVAAVSL